MRGDHYKLVVELIKPCDGKLSGYGADATVCTGQWVNEYQTDNEIIQRILSDTHVPHNAFHAAVAKLINF